MKYLKTQGFVLIDVDVAALNNAGKSQTSRNENAVETKKIRKNGKTYVYVSGQAWRYWWRETLKTSLGWELSPVIRDQKIAYTAADPIEYPDDDIFGYMKAAKETYEEKGKQKSRNITVTRVSPLKNSAIVSVAAVNPADNWSSMARGEGDTVPYVKEEYSAIMKGMFSIDLFWVGTFARYNRPGLMHLSQDLIEQAKKSGAETIDYEFEKDADGNAVKVYRLPKDIRVKRVVDAIRALKVINGGAMQTANKADVTPKFIVLATTKYGNHPFSHIAKSVGDWDTVAELDIDALREVLRDYKDDFEGNVFIGKRAGFMDEINDELKKLEQEFDFVKIYSVNEAIDNYAEQVKEQID